ncbi:MAG: glycosyltransferase family 4 protein [Isosphaeraceae bacterium]
MRSVLILTYHFPPSAASGSFRMLGFARHLPGHHWRAVVVAPPSLPWEPVDPELTGQVSPETILYPVSYPRSRLARRLALMSCWLPGAARACTRAIREQRPEVLMTSGPPQQIHWLGLWLKRRHGLPWLADFRDPWYPEGRFGQKRGRDLASLQVAAQEAAVMRAADAVIANAPGACQELRDAYPRHREKFVTLPNGYDRETFEDVRAKVSPRRSGGPIRVVHAGSIYVGRDPRPFLDAVKTLSDDPGPPLEVAFFGPPAESNLDLVHEVQARGLSARIKIHGQVPYAQVLREMAGAEILLLMDTPGRKVGVPAKLYEYIGAGRPVLALGEQGGDLARVLAESGVPHQIVPPDDPAAIARALATLAVEAGEGHAELSSRRDPHRFSREAIAGRLASLLNRCAPGGPDKRVISQDECRSESEERSPNPSVASGRVLT